MAAAPLAALALGVALAQAPAAPAGARVSPSPKGTTVFTGAAPFYAELALPVDGTLIDTPATVVKVGAWYHQMNLAPGSIQPIGLLVHFYIAKNPATGNASRCEQWVNQVRQDEQAWSASSATFPYLEIDVAPGAKPVTLNGQQIYRDSDVLCWEARDFGPPVY